MRFHLVHQDLTVTAEGVPGDITYDARARRVQLTLVDQSDPRTAALSLSANDLE